MSFKKSLIPAVVALGFAATASAQSTVQVYGVVDLTLGSYQYSGKKGTLDNSRLTKVDGNQMVPAIWASRAWKTWATD